jgi:transposase
MRKMRRSFKDELKREAVRLLKQRGAEAIRLTHGMGIEQSALRRWVEQEHGGVLGMQPNRPLRSEGAGA